MGKQLASLLILSIAVAFIGGCSLQQDSANNGSLSGTIIGGDPGINFAPTVDLDSAKLYIYVANPSFQTVQVYRALAPWAESTITYNSFGDGYDTKSFGSFVASSVGWHSVDITSLVHGWVNDSFPNYGLVLDQDLSIFPQAIYMTRESQFKPYLDISFTNALSDIQDVFESDADAFVDGSNPDNSDGTSLAMMTGWADYSGSEHKALLYFALPAMQPVQTYSSLSGQVWLDGDANGLHDPAELGLPGAVVTLKTCDTVFIETVETDIDGNYVYDSLVPGDYRVFIDLPSGYEITQYNIGLDENVDSDFDTIFGHSVCYTLDGLSDATDVDCGLVEVVTHTNDEICTHGHSYFKNRLRRGPKDDILSVLPIQLGVGDKSFEVDSPRAAYSLLKLHGSRDPWNGIVQLYRQLLTTKLNIALGADGSAISAQLAEIDTYLGSHDRSDWSELEKEEKQLVRGWKELLQSYNTGEIGPGSCDEEDIDEEGDDF